MRILFYLACLVGLCAVDANAQQLKTANDSLSYSLGVMVGNSLRQEGYTDLEMEQFKLGLETAYSNVVVLIPTERCESLVREITAQKKMKQYESNKVAGEQFLATNKTRSGVTSLADGMQYEILKAGDGAKPKATDEVLVHYHGTLTDGTIFDSSVDRGQPISFPLNQVISGWTEILQLMPVGSKWRVYIPYNLAYGDRPAGPHIKPYSTLIFEIELLGIN
ncbi:MAG TPA: FKBP-type peptidyl-prolyl cis-trans isomerase [Saprospiraceae bacterium]|nr:FKBP-type peptidyl-prolyl cis-trans isomerase [Saprospiraceae bacterium]